MRHAASLCLSVYPLFDAAETILSVRIFTSGLMLLLRSTIQVQIMSPLYATFN